MNDWKSERRAHARTDVICPIALGGEAGGEKIPGRAMNLSDSGAMLTIPMDCLTGLTPDIKLTISLPRVTANTHMHEEVATEATVVRHEPMVNEDLAGVAVRFSAPLDLQLEV